MERRYFVLDRPSLEEFKCLEMCIGAMHTQRYSLDGSKLLIKTTQLDIDNYITDITELGIEYSLEEIKLIMRTVAWTEELDFNI